MSAEDEFLARWSRRKREAVESADAAPMVEQQSGATAPDEKLCLDENKNSETPEAEFDLASLPSIESITSATDVSVFLRAGVPAELTRAALRRAWSADPAIRDFVGLAENAWDFTKPNEMIGFGPLESSAEEIRRMVAEIIDRTSSALEPGVPVEPVKLAQAPVSTNDSSAADPPVIDAGARQEALPAQDDDKKDAAPAGDPKMLADDGKVDFASQHQPLEADEGGQLPRRTHGRALPQ